MTSGVNEGLPDLEAISVKLESAAHASSIEVMLLDSTELTCVDEGAEGGDMRPVSDAGARFVN